MKPFTASNKAIYGWTIVLFVVFGLSFPAMKWFASVIDFSAMHGPGYVAIALPFWFAFVVGGLVLAVITIRTRPSIVPLLAGLSPLIVALLCCAAFAVFMLTR